MKADDKKQQEIKSKGKNTYVFGNNKTLPNEDEKEGISIDNKQTTEAESKPADEYGDDFEA